MFQKLPVKDFGSEVRALRDVENFLDSTLLLLDLQTTGLQDILSAMIHKLKESRTDTDEFSVKDAMDALLTQDSGKVYAPHCHKVFPLSVRVYVFVRVSLVRNPYLSRDMIFPTMWYVRPAKAQTSLRTRAV